MLKTNIKEKGFTIVELLIVIVIIGILGLLVLNTVTGAQARARDADRQSDINALHSQLEVYYNEEGGYPTSSQVGSGATATTLFPGLDENAVIPPRADGPSIVNSATPSETQYGYVPTGCGTGDNSCTGYSLYYQPERENDGAIVEKKSLNNQ